ncbi:MAG: hypothetical protein WC777_01710 [Candidatus Gracilibacteria bacterium]|jgi:hypothetical protein
MSLENGPTELPDLTEAERKVLSGQDGIHLDLVPIKGVSLSGDTPLLPHLTLEEIEITDALADVLESLPQTPPTLQINPDV